MSGLRLWVETMTFLSTGQASSKFLETLSQKRHPIVVLEGLDGTGKSTQVELLTEKLNAHHISTSTLDSAPKTIQQRREAYMNANHSASNEMTKICVQRPIVVDRYLASTLSSHFAHFPFYPFSVENWESVYCHAGLVVPSLVINIELDEEIRGRRLAARDEPLDDFEKRLVSEEGFRSCMKAWLRVMSTHTIDASAMSIQELHTCIMAHVKGVL
jgi:UMP-CMP kinase 2, mitochondrial